MPGVCDASVIPGRGPVGEMRAHVRQPCGARQLLPRGAPDQRFAGGACIGDAAEDDALASFPDCTIDQSSLGVDDDPAAGRIDRRRLAELQREVERLAEQDDQVGAADRIGESAECCVVEAAWAFHDGGRDLRRRFDAREQITSGTIRQLRAREQERPLRRGNDAEDGVGRRIREADR